MEKGKEVCCNWDIMMISVWKYEEEEGVSFDKVQEEDEGA